MKPGVGLIAKKLGMTQVFRPDGRPVAVTVLEAGPCPVVQIKEEKTDGYRAVQLGFEERPAKRLNKPQTGHFEKKKVKLLRTLREFRIGKEETFEPGSTMTVDLFKPGDFVNVTGISKGKGMQGGMARWNWSGGPKSHGSMAHRRPGSIGASAQPSRVIKGTHLPGRMGNDRITTPNLEVIEVDADNHLLLVKGAVPGFDTSTVVIRKSRKKRRVAAPKEAPDQKKGEGKKGREEKADKGEKGEKAEKGPKGEKAPKADKPEKAQEDKPKSDSADKKEEKA